VSCPGRASLKTPSSTSVWKWTFNDGRFATLSDVVNHYDSVLKLRLTEQEKNDLIEYLKSI
jgi:hypothetical protein